MNCDTHAGGTILSQDELFSFEECYHSSGDLSRYERRATSPYVVQFYGYKNRISTWTDMNVITKVKSLVDTGLCVPRQLWVSSIQFPVGDICYQVQLKRNNGYQDVKFGANVDYFATQDSVYKLRKNLQIAEEDNLCSYYSFQKKGQYRARALYHASKFNNLEDIYSNWFYFTVDNDRLYLTGDSSPVK